MRKSSFAAWKRRITVGTRIQCVENTVRPELNGQLRTVREVQTNALAYTLDNGETNFWTRFEKGVRILDADTIKMPMGNLRGVEHYVILRIVGGITEGSGGPRKGPDGRGGPFSHVIEEARLERNLEALKGIAARQRKAEVEYQNALG